MKRLPACLSLLVFLPAAAIAQTGAEYEYGSQQGNFDVTLGGSGTNDNDFETGDFAISGSIGYFVTDNVLVSLRQTVNAGLGEDDDFNGSTRLAADYVFEFDRWQPFVGAQVGGIYGENVDNTGVAGPEAGLRVYVNPLTYLFGQVEYQFLFEDAGDVEDNFDDGVFVYTVGIGFNFWGPMREERPLP
jgi:hypothetical protein